MKTLGAAFLLLLLTAPSCGYNLVGRGGQFPEGVERVAVPVFENRTGEVEVARRLRDDFIEELLGTGKVTVVSAGEAQAEVRGRVTAYTIEPITFDTNRRALENRVVLTMDVGFHLSGQQEPAFEEKGVSVYYEYPVASDLAAAEKAEEEALAYVAREMSQKMISLLTEGF